jgi:hypothetical protein
MNTMNRCQSLVFRPVFRRLLALCVTGAALAAQAQQQAQPLPPEQQQQRPQGVRQFPAAALRATLSVSAPPDILLNGNRERLAPGARIRNANNMLVVSASLVGATYIVNYVREPQGLVKDVWLLTEAEVAEKRKGMEPVTNFTFQSDADKPRTDDGKTPFQLLPKFPRQ